MFGHVYIFRKFISFVFILTNMLVCVM